MEKVLPYMKFVVAVLGAGVTAALQGIPAENPAHVWLTIASAVLTAVAVYAVPNKPANAA